MGLVEAEEEGTTIQGETTGERKPRQRSKPQSQPAKKNGLDTEVNKSDLSENLSSVFDGLAFVMKSDAEFSKEEFTGIANDLAKVSNKLLPLRILLNALSFVVVAPKLLRQVKKLMAGRKPQPQPMYPAAEGAHAG